MQLFKNFFARSSILIVFAIGFFPHPIFAQEKTADKAEQTVGPFTGTVVDKAEKPVPGGKSLAHRRDLPF